MVQKCILLPVTALLIVLLSAQCGFCKPVTVTDVKKVAQRYLNTRSVLNDGFSIKSIKPLLFVRGAQPLAYHIALRPAGYIIIASDDRLCPVIAYSTETDLNLSDNPENTFRMLLKQDLSRLRDLIERKSGRIKPVISLSLEKNFEKNRRLWQRLLSADSQAQVLNEATESTTDVANDPSGNIIGPLLGTISWNQNNHYNELCPLDPYASEYYDNHMPVGCVAVAAGQIMKYHQWPLYGQGSHTYSWNSTELSADFSDNYAWNLMQNSYDPWSWEPADAEMAVSELLYELGVSVEMNYSHRGSAASLHYMADSLNSYFFYELGTSHGAYYTPDNLIHALQTEMEALRPVMAGIIGHAVVIDGEDASSDPIFFHINYGWGGYNNGWYALNHLPNGNFVEQIFTGIQPRFMALFEQPTSQMDPDGNFELRWVFPMTRTSELNSLQLDEGVYQPDDFLDTADDFQAWNFNGDWNIQEDNAGGSFYFPPDKMGIFNLTLSDPFMATQESALSFDYKAAIADAVLSLQVYDATDKSWQTLFEVDKYTASGNWQTINLELSGYSGKQLWVRFHIDASKQPFHYVPAPSGGIWIDNFTISGSKIIQWNPLETNLPPNTTSYSVTERDNGTYLYRILACSEQACGKHSPSATINVHISSEGADFDHDNDVDGEDLIFLIHQNEDMDVEEFAMWFGTVY